MTRFLCQAVPCALLSLALAGCFGSHGEPGGSPDAGPPGADGGGIVPPPPGDGGAPPPSCPERAIDLACYDTIRAGVAFDLPVLFGGRDSCFCGEAIDCRVGLGGEPNTLEMSTGLCVGGALCDACFPFVEGQCSLPPLTAGEWTVRVNGAPAFSLDVTPEGVFPERADVCVRSATRDDSCGILFPPVTGSHDGVCHEGMAYPDTRLPIEVMSSCGGCGAAAGPCEVTVFDDVIRVSPSTVWSGCDVDCPAVCVPRTDVCYTPPLAPGIYRVMVDGLGGYESELRVATPREPVMPGLICGPLHADETTPWP